MKILLTGASGFIGKEICRQALADYRYVSRSNQNGHSDTFIVDNIDGYTSWEGAFDDCYSVIHLAGVAHNNQSTISDFYEVNFEGTLNLAKSAAKAGVKRFVFVSSVGVLGNVTESSSFTNQSIAAPHNDYAKSKWQAEEALFELQRETGMEVVVVRPPLVYGSRAPGNFGMLTKLVKLLPVLPFGCIDNKRSVISSKNLADFIYCCTHAEKLVGKAWLVAEPTPVSTKELIHQIAAAESKLCWQLPIPKTLMHSVANLLGKRKIADQLFGDLILEVGDTLEQSGWKPPYSMKQGLSSNQKEE